MSEPGFTITLRDVYLKVESLITEVQRFGGQISGIEAAAAIGVSQRADHETRIRGLENSSVTTEAIDRYRRQAKAGLWAGISGLAAAAGAVGAFLANIHLH